MREGIPRGATEKIGYASKIVGTTRKMLVYTPPAELIPHPEAVKAQLKYFMLSCGNQDGLISISQGLHAYLNEHDVPHVGMSTARARLTALEKQPVSFRAGAFK